MEESLELGDAEAGRRFRSGLYCLPEVPSEIRTDVGGLVIWRSLMASVRILSVEQQDRSQINIREKFLQIETGDS